MWIKLSIDDTFHIMNLTYKSKWFDTTYMCLNVHISSETKWTSNCDSIIDNTKG